MGVKRETGRDCPSPPGRFGPGSLRRRHDSTATSARKAHSARVGRTLKKSETQRRFGGKLTPGVTRRPKRFIYMKSCVSAVWCVPLLGGRRS
jgi:hypothetical protein